MLRSLTRVAFLGPRATIRTFQSSAHVCAGVDAGVGVTSKMTESQVTESFLRTKLDVSFQTKDILSQALTHSSFKHGTVPNNERLEIIGRRYLEFVAMDMALSTAGEQLPDKVLDMTSNGVLAARFDTLDMGLGLQANVPDVSNSMKAIALKALVGAVYHDRGIEETKRFIEKYVYVQ
ncbi:ribonuclease III domain-containing protein [Spinellus fusiger]|nr:ribonuclease III domain-containing protein [Spinellus fusiger]